VIDDVLIDPSGGQGQLLDLTRVEPLVHKLYEDHLPIGVGIAGGLTATTVNNLDLLVKQYPDLSIDAEGGLRTPDDQLNEDQVDWYVQAAQKMFT
jgi:phosphoribosylanthranilate isomerase